MNTLAWGKELYGDDLITKEKSPGQGYGMLLLDHVAKVAKDNECAQVHLDTSYSRHGAHKVYLSYGFELICHHMALNLT
jgi:GNAT superfamily N-acetyltransferase